jgi:guanylate kinase
VIATLSVEGSLTLVDPQGSRPGRLIVLSGASGSGKSTLVSKLLQQSGLRLQQSISATTRAPRAGEEDGKSYHFVTTEEFRRGLDHHEFLESAEVHGHLYGTPIQPVRESLERGICIILVIDVQGAFQVRERMPEAVLIFVHTPSFEVLETRLRDRKTDDEATIQQRLTNARREIALSAKYDHQIVNDDLKRATEELATLLTDHGCGG